MLVMKVSEEQLSRSRKDHIFPSRHPLDSTLICLWRDTKRNNNQLFMATLSLARATSLVSSLDFQRQQ